MDTPIFVSAGRRVQAIHAFNRPVHGARGLFAFAVFVFHVVNSGLPTWHVLALPPIQFLLRTTEYGVELFFCISGYVICGTLRRARGPLAFFEDRGIRIYPVLTASILAIAGLGLATGVRGFDTDQLGLLWRLPVNMMALPGVLPIDNLHPAAWSLSYEMCFYLFCALAWSLRRWWGLPAAWALAPAAAVMIVCYPRAVFLLAGVLVAEGYLSRDRIGALARYPALLLVLFLLVWHEVAILSLPRNFTETTMVAWAADARLPLAGLAFVAATLGFAGIVDGYGVLGRLLRTRPLQYFGTISYSFYLWHPIVMSGVKTAMLRSGVANVAGHGAQALFFLLALPPALTVAHVSQRVLERGAGVWLRRKLHHPVPLQTAAAPAGTGPIAIVPTPQESLGAG